MTKFNVDHWQSFARIIYVVSKRRTADAAGLFFSADTNEKGMLSRAVGSMKYFDRTSPGRDDAAVSKADPLVPVLRKKLIAGRPICRLILAPIRMDLLSNFVRQAVGKAIHRAFFPSMTEWKDPN
jgi:hypothetical protein